MILATLAPACCASVFEWWQSTDVQLFSRERVSAAIHTQLRLRRFHDVFQGILGPVVRVILSPRWFLSGGYYFGEAVDGDEWRNNQRLFAAIERQKRLERGMLTLRTTGEYHYGGSNPSDRRFRQQIIWAHRAPLTPYIGTETFFDRHGFLLQRLQGGVRHPITARYLIDFGYICDLRKHRAGETRHVIQTAIRPRRRDPQ